MDASGRLAAVRFGQALWAQRLGFRCPALVRRHHVVDLGVDGAVADLLDDKGLHVEERFRGMRRVSGLRVDLRLALERRLQKVHLGTREALEDGGELLVGEALDLRGEHPRHALLLGFAQLPELVKAFVMRLHGLEQAKQGLGVQRAGLCQRLERFSGGLQHPC